jgi:trimeric autotransporter adhesin
MQSAGAIALLMSLLASFAGAQNNVTTVAGGGPNNLPALQSSLGYPTAMAWDTAGNFYIFDADTQRVLKQDTSGNVTVVLGSGIWGYLAGTGLSAQFAGQGMTMDKAGNIYIADTDNCAVEKINSSGNILVVTGDSNCGYSGDGGPAYLAEVNYPRSVAVDNSGNVFIADTRNCLIREVYAANHNIATVAGTPGTCGYGGDGGAATSAMLNEPYSVVVDGSGNLYIADYNNSLVREVAAATGYITTVAGNSTLGAGYSGDGGPATSAQLDLPNAITLDGSGNIFISDGLNEVIREVTASTGNISTVAGTYCDVVPVCTDPGHGGDGGPASQAWLNVPLAVAVDGTGNIFIAADSVIREVSTGTINTAAGVSANNVYGTPVGLSYFSGDGYSPTQASLGYPYALVSDGAGNILVADTGNNAIRKISPAAGVISTIAGNGLNGFYGDGSPATQAELSGPFGVAVDGSGNIFIADTYNCVVREIVAATGYIQTIAGTAGSCGFSGDGGAATAAQLSSVGSVSVDKSGNIFVADWNNYVIREITSADGKIHTVAGTPGTLGNSGDGGPATSAQLDAWSVLVDGSGNLYIADGLNCAVREVTAANGYINTIAGTNGTCGYSGDGGLATQAELGDMGTSLFLDPAGDLFIPDCGNAVVREVSAATGIINTVAGNGIYGYYGDGGPALSAEFSSPLAAAADMFGDLLVIDGLRIRSVAGLIQQASPPQAGISPLGLEFPIEPLGTTAAAQQLTLTNTGTTAVSISSVAISGTNKADFGERDNCSGQNLTGGATCTINVTFTPSLVATETATLTVTDTAGTQTAQLVGAGLDFSVAAASGGSTSATVTQGQTASYSLQLTASGGIPPGRQFPRPQMARASSSVSVTITCSGAPAGATCTVPSQPVVVTVGMPATFNVSVSTTAPQAAAAVAPGAGPTVANIFSTAAILPAGVMLLAFWPLTLTRLRARRRELAWLTVALLLLMVALGCSGVSHSGAGGTPVGTYTLNLTATSGNDSHTTQLTLTVNAAQ